MSAVGVADVAIGEPDAGTHLTASTPSPRCPPAAVPLDLANDDVRQVSGWRRFMRRIASRSPLAWLLIGFVRVWRAIISPLYGDVCKFHPTCSSYGLTALEVHGALKGSWLIARRLVRCHPWSLGGHDPVPGAEGHPRSLQGDRLS